MKMAMVSAVVVALILLEGAATHTARVAADMDPLLPTCKSLGGGSTYFGIDFCLSALGSDARSRRAGISEQDLSIITVDLLTANATSTEAKIAGLIQAGGDGDATTRRGLASCQALYGGILQRQPACAAAIKGGRFRDATSALEKAASAAKECEHGFVSKGDVASSPLTAEDDNAFKLAKLAVALLSFASPVTL